MSRIRVAVDAMGGDRAPEEIVAGALRARDEADVDVLLVGREDAIRPLLPGGAPPEGVEVLHAADVIAMHDDPASSVRTRKDASLVRCAEAVRDGRAQAMVGAGNTGATMAAALLRMGRVKGIARPGIGLLIPRPGMHAQLLVDGGATTDADPEWLVQFAAMGATYARVRLGLDAPTIGLLSNGEEPGKGDELRKKTYALLDGTPGFVGNVEGRDLMSPHPDVVVTDGFTGNVALKTIEGAVKAVASLVFGVLSREDVAEAGAAVMGPLLEIAGELDPDATGGAMLLGVNGVCVISHGSSSATAIVNAARVARDSVTADIVSQLEESAQRAG
ncbi:MAG TPA: phosphate acyltransferase PlsX [Acidimicrobiia bacterium]|nr:phosphate acyltransferase PlsX [Acidimicrobiia bacterium]